MAANTFLTVADAAKRVGVSRQTIFEKIKRGLISATLGDGGVKVVDVSELLRVFPRLLSDDEVKKKQLDKTRQSVALPLASTLQLELERAKLQLEKKDFELEQMRQRVDELRERERAVTEEKLRLFGIVERQTLLLTAPKPATTQRAKAAPKVAPTPAKSHVKSHPARPQATRPAVQKTGAKKAGLKA
jgi:hypothetical protein